MVFLLRLRWEAAGGGGCGGAGGGLAALHGTSRGDPGCSPAWQRTPAGCFQGLLIPTKVAGLRTLAVRAGVTHGHRGADRGQPRHSLKSLQGLWSPQLP